MGIPPPGRGMNQRINHPDKVKARLASRALSQPLHSFSPIENVLRVYLPNAAFSIAVAYVPV